MASDGVSLAFTQIGAGEPLILVHGSATTRRCFDLVADRLAESFTVVRYDRRGYGASDDGALWSLRREVDDLTELATSVGGESGVCVLGYSFGGVIAIEAAKTTPAAIHALVAYEPPFGADRLVSAGPELKSMLDEGRLEDAARLFITSTFHVTDSVVDAMRRNPMWEITIGVLPRLRRKLPAVEAARVTSAAGAVPPTRVLVAVETF